VGLAGTARWVSFRLGEPLTGVLPRGGHDLFDCQDYQRGLFALHVVPGAVFLPAWVSSTRVSCSRSLSSNANDKADAPLTQGKGTCWCWESAGLFAFLGSNPLQGCG